ncbi:hypothetical protein V7S43_002272 [Phytophthora oleae]|uniref:Uncharacterized protein n=1 Tax=Phytophthora oleae TaxID=2107226 RepID=A0ABD3G1K7_9STRA
MDPSNPDLVENGEASDAATARNQEQAAAGFSELAQHNLEPVAFPVAPPMQSTQAVYIVMQAIPLAVGAQAQVLLPQVASCSCSTDNRDPIMPADGHIYSRRLNQRQQFAVSVQQVQYAQNLVGLPCVVADAVNTSVPQNIIRPGRGTKVQKMSHKRSKRKAISRRTSYSCDVQDI